MSKNTRTKQQLDAFRKELEDTGDVRRALEVAEYGESAQRQGWKLVKRTKALKEIADDSANELVKMGMEYLANPEKMHALAIGRVATATIEGSEKGVNAARTLGSHKSVRAFTPENTVNIFQNIQALEGLLTLPESNDDL